MCLTVASAERIGDERQRWRGWDYDKELKRIFANRSLERYNGILEMANGILSHLQKLTKIIYQFPNGISTKEIRICKHIAAKRRSRKRGWLREHSEDSIVNPNHPTFLNEYPISDKPCANREWTFLSHFPLIEIFRIFRGFFSFHTWHTPPRSAKGGAACGC